MSDSHTLEPIPPKRTSRFKSMLNKTKTSVTTSLSALVAGPPSDEPSTFKAKMFNAKRRVTQAAMQKFGSVEPSADPEAAAMTAAVAEIDRYLHTFFESVNAFREAIQMLSSANAQIAAVAQHTYSDAPPEFQTPASTYVSAIHTMDAEIRKAMDTMLVNEVLHPIKAKLATVEDLKKRCKLRETYKLDFDSYTRSVASIKSKSSPDPDKLRTAEAKLANSEQVLASFTRELYSEINDLRTRRYEFAELSKFQTVQRCFLTAAQRTIASVPDFPTTAGKAPLRDPMVDTDAAASAADGAGAGAGAGAPPSLPAVPPSLPAVPPPAPVCRARALHAYAPHGDDELALNPGDELTVTRKEDDGWWFGAKADGSTGAFPSNFVQEL